ncbi:EspF repeat-containing protein [Kitasatospora sp. NPDC059673]
MPFPAWPVPDVPGGLGRCRPSPAVAGRLQQHGERPWICTR